MTTRLRSLSPVEASFVGSRNANQSFYEAISSIYDRLYDEVDAAEAVRQWLLLIAENQPKLTVTLGQQAQPRLLDLGCGTGQYLEPWASAGFCVTGVDGSIGMVRRARRRKVGSSHSAQINLVRHDLRLPSTRLKGLGPFDIAVAHFNFLNLFPLSEVQAILCELRHYLSVGSRFVTDCAPPDLIPLPGIEFRQLGPKRRIQITTKPDPGSRSVTQTYRGEGPELHETYWFHSTRELTRAAQGAGWKLEAVVGWRPDRAGCPWSSRRGIKSHRVCVFRV
jgi:SAM-dependent methyltransferase